MPIKLKEQVISGTDEYRADNYIRNTKGTLIFFIPDSLPVVNAGFRCVQYSEIQKFYEQAN